MLSQDERRLLLAIAKAAMPQGARLPAADERAIDGVERFLSQAPSSFSSAYRAGLTTLRFLARWSRLRLDSAPEEEVLAFLDRCRRGDYARRTALRLVLAPLKAAHYGTAEIYRAVGCLWHETPASRETPRYLDRALSASTLSDGEVLETDVVVIGTGAGGAVVAKELAERGHAVVMLEEGKYFRREDFGGSAGTMQERLYRDLGATFAIGNTAIPVPIGKTVGGTTTINSGTCYRPPERVLRHWAIDFGLEGLSPERLAPYFDRVESVLEVTPAQMEHVGALGRVIARGSDRLGYRHRPLARNAPACDGQGVCCFGCPTDAKRSTNVSYVPLALKAGATLVTEILAERVLMEGDRAVGVLARGPSGLVTIRARTVVVSCGSLLTPLFLDGSGLGRASSQLGQNLTIHPAAAAMALFDEKIDGARSIPQGYAIEEFHDEGILFEGAFAPLDVGAASLPMLGPEMVHLLERYDHASCFGFMIEDSSRGSVRRGPDGKPLILYRVNDLDVARLKRGVEILARVYFAAGARSVYPLVHGFDRFDGEHDVDRFRAARLSARDFELSAYHPLGTARMGRDPRTSVVDPTHRLHDTRGVYVVDGSVLPSSPAVNPQITIMALATRAAEHISHVQE